MEPLIYLYDNLRITNSAEIDNMLYIEGLAAHWNKANLNNEIVTENSFDTFFSMFPEKLRPVINWEHQSEHQLGLIDNVAKTPEGLFIEAHINMDIPLVKDNLVYNIKSGDLIGLSTEGYIQGGYDGIIEHDNGTYTVKDFLLTAVAITKTPADYNASFSVKNYIDTLKPIETQSVTPKWYFM